MNVILFLFSFLRPKKKKKNYLNLDLKYVHKFALKFKILNWLSYPHLIFTG